MPLEGRRKRRAEYLGLPVNVEIEAGEEKRGRDDLGQEWSHTYLVPYGEILGTEGEDGDPVDVYLGPFETEDALVYVVHQLHRDRTPDEDKVMLGFPGAAEAEDAYRLHGPPWGFGSMDEMTFAEFTRGYLAGQRAPAHLQLPDTAAGREAAGKTRYGS